jgi:hypothetical protein
MKRSNPVFWKLYECNLCGFKTRDKALWKAHLWACG